jgi:hypothetical protein
MHEQVIDNTETTGLMFETMPVPPEDEAEVQSLYGFTDISLVVNINVYVSSGQCGPGD